MDNKLLYVTIFIVVLVIFIYLNYTQKENFTSKNSNKMNRRPNNRKTYRNNHRKLPRIPNPPENNREILSDITDIKQTLNNYIKEVKKLEHRLKTKGLLDDELIKLDSLPQKDDYNLFYTKSIDDKIDTDVYENFVSFAKIGKKISNTGIKGRDAVAKTLDTVGKKIPNSIKKQFSENKKACPIDKLDSDQIDQLDKTKNIKKYINLSGEESVIQNLTTSLEKSSHEEGYLGDESLDSIKIKSDLSKGTYVYQYRDKKNKEIYRIYQNGNVISLKEGEFINLISNSSITLNTVKTNKINLDKKEGTKIYSKNRVELLGSFKNTINLEEKKGINIQSNENITLNQINNGNSQKGQVNMEPKSVKIMHTSKVVLKVGVNVIVIDEDSINLFGDNVNLMASDSISLTTDSLHIDANTTTINSNLDILGAVNIYDSINIEGTFNHRGDSFNSTVTPVSSLTPITAYEKCFNYMKNKNIQNINKYQKLGGIDSDNYADDVVQVMNSKVEDIQKLFDGQMMDKFSAIMNLIGLGKYGKVITKVIKKIDGKFNKPPKETSTLSITPGEINITTQKLGSDIMGSILNSLQEYSNEKLYELYEKIFNLLPTTKWSHEIVSKLDRKIYKMALSTNNLVNKYTRGNADLLINLASAKYDGADTEDLINTGLETIKDKITHENTGNILTQSEDFLKNKLDELEDSAKEEIKQQLEAKVASIREELEENIKKGLENISERYIKQYADNQKTPIRSTMAQSFNKLLNVMENIPGAVSSLSINNNDAKISIGPQSNFNVGLLNSHITTPELNITGPEETGGKMSACNFNSLLFNIVSQEIALEGNAVGVTGITNFFGETNMEGNLEILGDVSIESPAIALAVNSGPNIFSVNAESIVMEAPLKQLLGGETNITGANTNINGSLTVEGTANVVGSTSIEGPLDVVGLVGVEGEITAPTAIIGEVTGTCLNAINAENALNAENSENSVVAETAVFATNAASAEFAPKCFSGDSRILMGDNTYKSIKFLQIGDYVKTMIGIKQVIKVHKNYINKSIKVCYKDDNFIATYHPILYNKEWYFAKDKLPLIEKYIDYFYNLELDCDIPEGNTIYIGSQICCTLGWGDDNNRLYKKDKVGKLYDSIWGRGWKKVQI